VVTISGNGNVTITGNITDSSSGRFIQIQNNGPISRLLHISEIEAFARGVVHTTTGFDNANDLALTSQGASFESTNGVFVHATLGNDSPLNGAAETAGDTWTYQGVGTNYVADLGTTRNL